MKIGLNSDSFGIGNRFGKSKTEEPATKPAASIRSQQTYVDSAGRALADKLNSTGAIYEQALVNVNSGVSLLSVAESALSEMSSILGQIQELAADASSESIGYDLRVALNNEAQALKEEYNRIKSTTKFNEISVINNSSRPSVELQTGESQQAMISAVLAVVNEESYEISTPTGQFDVATSQALTEASADGVKLLDLNNDSVLDAVVGHINKISVLLGNGDGSFSTLQTYSVGYTVFNLTTTDVNNDGNADIISNGFDTSNDGYVSVLSGAGNGAFSFTSTFTAESRISASVDTADLNGDGFVDLVSSGRTDSNIGQVNVFFGNGTGVYGARTSYTMQAFASREVKIGDINGDGTLDIVTAGYSASDGNIAVRLGTGGGVFGALTQFSADTGGSFALELVDLDGDSALDVITGGRTDGNTASVSVLKGNNDGTFQNAQSYSYSGLYVSSVTTADIDSDGKLDLAAALGSGGVSVRYGTTGIAFGANTNYAGGSQTNSLAIADLNNDDALDIVSTDIRSALAGITINLGETIESLIDLDDLSLLTTELAENAYLLAVSAKDTVDKEIGKIEGQLSRLEYTFSDLQAQSTNFGRAEARIRSFEDANESSKSLGLGIVSDGAAAVFAQANQNPDIVLALLDPDSYTSEENSVGKLRSSFPDTIPKAKKSINSLG